LGSLTFKKSVNRSRLAALGMDLKYVADLQGCCSQRSLNFRSQVGSFSGELSNLELKPWQRKCSRRAKVRGPSPLDQNVGLKEFQGGPKIDPYEDRRGGGGGTGY
jgi:hypothetical protein